MNKLFSILILTSIVSWSVHATEIKPPIQYNMEATQKLQHHIDSTLDKKSLDAVVHLLATPSLQEMNSLINQGADPNTGFIMEMGEKKYPQPLLLYLLIGPTFIDHVDQPLDLALMEQVTKNALIHGADANATDNFGSNALGFGIQHSSPTQVQLLLDYGANPQVVQSISGKDPEIIIEQDIRSDQNDLPKAQGTDLVRLQNHISRLQQIREILRKALQKK